MTLDTNDLLLRCMVRNAVEDGYWTAVRYMAPDSERGEQMLHTRRSVLQSVVAARWKNFVNSSVHSALRPTSNINPCFTFHKTHGSKYKRTGIMECQLRTKAQFGFPRFFFLSLLRWSHGWPQKQTPQTITRFVLVLTISSRSWRQRCWQTTNHCSRGNSLIQDIISAGIRTQNGHV
jgi:hypothetical protein